MEVRRLDCALLAGGPRRAIANGMALASVKAASSRRSPRRLRRKYTQYRPDDYGREGSIPSFGTML